VGWAWAMDTPFQWTKQVASHWGGTRNGTIVHWPKGVSENGGLRSQFCHVIDVAPTVLELAGIPEPSTVNGVTQSPYEGTSMAYTFDAADAPERHEVQYFEMFGNRGIYHKGWSAVTKHRTPWKLAVGTKTIPFDEDVWELYDGSKDYSQAHDLVEEMPEKLHELQALWLDEARKYNAIPLDDRAVERLVPELAGRPAAVKGDRQIFYPGMARISEASVLNIKNKSFQVTAQLVVPDEGASGTIIAQGGGIGGWGLLAHEGAARFVYNLFGVNVFVIDAVRPVPAGEHQVRAEFAYAGEGYAKGGDVTLYYDGQQVGEGKVAVTQPMIFSATEGLEIGRELGTTVLPGSSPEKTVFTGEIKWVELSVGEDDQSHLIDAEDHLQLLMSQQ
ncbi:MAG TPA: sulfatase/phosphatase domain-containing protein, partial [Gaiellaceae bacterium]|nr:sulfatase/phosphatase domain-containing protein [Gaiellaceae bacterium]